MSFCSGPLIKDLKLISIPPTGSLLFYLSKLTLRRKKKKSELQGDFIYVSGFVLFLFQKWKQYYNGSPT